MKPGRVAQSLHDSRYRASDSFELLVEELEAQRTARAQRTISLLESERQQEILERKAGRGEREELYRKAFGASSRDEDDSETSVPDIILEEAANVLSDIIDSPPTTKP